MRQGSQLLSIVLLFLVILGSVFFIFPMRDSVADLKVERDAVLANFQELDTNYSALSTLSNDVAKSQATRNALAQAVPQGLSQDDLILDLSEMAEDAGFDLNAMSFSKGVHQEFGNTLTVTANFSGSYSQLIEFLQQVESADRLMQVTSLNVQLTSTTAVVFNLSIETYYQ